MASNTLFSYVGNDFDLVRAITDRKTPIAHREAIYRGLLKAQEFPYHHLTSSEIKSFKKLTVLYDGTPLYSARPHGEGGTQYRLPIVSLAPFSFLVLGFFHRKDADFAKEIAVATRRYQKIRSSEATYEPLIIEQLVHV